MQFKDILDELGIMEKYLKTVKAKMRKYDNHANVRFSSDPKYKLEAYNKNTNKWVKFGGNGYHDFIIYSLSNPEVAVKKRQSYLSRANNIKGDWKDDKYSRNNLSIHILW